VVAGHVVELVRVSTPHRVPLADLVVDERAYPDVGAHERFARRYLLVGFNDERCAQIVAGHEGITLCGPRTRRA
jgi:hypothetical protein